jgi:hypothetical protein
MSVARLRVVVLWFLLATPSLFGCSGSGKPDESKPAPPSAAAQSSVARSTRSFQMALWFNPTGADADIAFFRPVESQPQGRSILVAESWRNLDSDAIRSDFASGLAARDYDWSRIVAVVVDEPYWYYTGHTDESNPCRNPRDPRNAQITQIAAQLEQAAAIIRDLSPSTRFWVNFSVHEVRWASDAQCPVPINYAYIDVVSLDSYWGRFEDVVRPYNEWLRDHPASAYQQLALVPGTFYREGADNQQVQASYFAGYFDYANSLNASCDLPTGRVGVTGQWDGCPIWIVAGWAAGTYQEGKYLYRGALDPAATAILAAWREELAYPTLDPIVGKVEKYDSATRTLTGWAVNRNSLGVPQHIDVRVNGQHAGSTVSDLPRTDIGDEYGIYDAGFSLTLPQDAGASPCITATASPAAGPPDQVSLPSAVTAGSC